MKKAHVIFGEELSADDVAELGGLAKSAVYHRLQKLSPLAAALMPQKRLDAIADGATFGRLTIVRESGRSAAGKRLYECRCDCGNTKVVVGADLKSGRTLSCGCRKSEATSLVRQAEAEDITGREFADGLLRVIGQGGLVERKAGERIKRVRQWVCECSCGKQFEARAAALKRGQITSCGCRRSERARQNCKKRAAGHDYFGEVLTLAEIANVSGVNAPTIAYRMRTFGVSAQEAVGMKLRTGPRAGSGKVGPIMSSGQRVCKACGFSGHHTGTCLANKGLRFGALVVLRGGESKRRGPGGKDGESWLYCRCDCGVEKEVRTTHLRQGVTKSCGCRRFDAISTNVPRDPTARFDVLGEQLTVGEIAALVKKRPDQIWAKIVRGMSAEEAAFGKVNAAAMRAVVGKEPSALRLDFIDFEEVAAWAQ